eukprot:scaffold2780_cov174-Amphora_coffeaeformis.AAC.15
MPTCYGALYALAVAPSDNQLPADMNEKATTLYSLHVEKVTHHFIFALFSALTTNSDDGNNNYLLSGGAGRSQSGAAWATPRSRPHVLLQGRRTDIARLTKDTTIPTDYGLEN